MSRKNTCNVAEQEAEETARHVLLRAAAEARPQSSPGSVRKCLIPIAAAWAGPRLPAEGAPRPPGPEAQGPHTW